MSALEPSSGLSTAGTLIKSSHLTGISQPANERRGNYLGPFLGWIGGGGATEERDGAQEGGEDEEVEEVAGDDL